MRMAAILTQTAPSRKPDLRAKNSANPMPLRTLPYILSEELRYTYGWFCPFRPGGVGSMRAQLVPLDKGESVEITKEMTLVGRGEGCDLRLEHKSVSKLHCVLVKTDGLIL